ncbi:peptidase C14, caspase catalytic subunit p20 [Magnetococcus marinus MC-1]|uniref:Peptidase C14, caspase catalytic subunit p20 n=1 Tax=Magnetococcus marinus (strain ATCC BAA-1437 / JCM 17883 / MC-1) TaxID=156889 RepID=A0LCL4_MAGMM|nr:caspase family protein [Magnetococcus marinus]ABK45707.1 peptidase C14, caspase catalytic subunit p20 [Magnetococcus marinus MC-1]
MWRPALFGLFTLLTALVPLSTASALEVLGERANACPAAREIALKGIGLFDVQPKKGLAALQEAYELCPADLAVGYNHGLALYLSDQKEQALHIWAKVLETHPDHLHTIANHAWTFFELGKDEDAHIAAFKALERFPGDFSLAHTKLYSLFRMGRYLEAYDWLNRANLQGLRAKKWQEQAARYVVEWECWRKFRAGEQYEALKQSINLLVKEYAKEEQFVVAKDMLARAHVDNEAEVPIVLPLPHEIWAKQGDVDDQRLVLDDYIEALPPINGWEKRTDTFALIIGISRYAHLPGRYFSARDADNMAKLLVRRGILQGDPDHLRLRTDREATTLTLQRDVDWLLEQGRLNPNAQLIFYYSGHGVPYQAVSGGALQDLLMVPVDVRQTWIAPEHALSMKDLRDSLDALQNRDVAVIVDSCFSGKPPCLARDVQLKPHHRSGAERAQKPWLLAAWDDRAAHYYAPGRQSAMTYFLLKGMLGAADGAANSGKDGWVGLSEAFLYVRDALQEKGIAMTPWMTQSSTMRLTQTGGDR